MADTRENNCSPPDDRSPRLQIPRARVNGSDAFSRPVKYNISIFFFSYIINIPSTVLTDIVN